MPRRTGGPATRRRRALAAVAGAAMIGSACSSGAAGTVSPAAPKSVYLALGDSVAFGYRPAGMVPKPNYHDPGSFVGYPELAAATLGLRSVNAACPGETVTSMITPSAANNGCENTDGRSGGYREAYPLHVAYTGSQLAYAVGYLRTHRTVRLVSVGIGLNDLVVCVQRSSDGCAGAAEQTALAASIRAGLRVVLDRIRGAGYRGRLVVVTYYSPTRAEQAAVADLDTLLRAAAASHGAVVADGAGAFDRASSAEGGDLCAAGLLVRLPGGSCDEHPSAKGQADLAAAVVAAARS